MKEPKEAAGAERPALTVHYDDACASCVRDRALRAPVRALRESAAVVDITGREAELCRAVSRRLRADNRL